MDKPASKQRPWSTLKEDTSHIANRKRDPFYHSSRWTRASRMFRTDNPLCAQCERDGLIVPSEVTDHVIPKDVCPDPWDQNNWEPLCKKCHARKGSKDRKHFKK